MTLNANEVSSKYNRFSFFYDFVEKPMEIFLFRKWRKEALQKLEGNVLEIGVGTGKNFPYYNYNKVDLTAIDLSEGMLSKAKDKVKKKNYPVKLKLENAEHLSFKDNSFDYVIATFVLCSVPNPVKALKEMKRVVKKEGKIILLEHMLSKNKLIAFFGHLHNPISRFLFGFNINRKTIESIKKCGLTITTEKDLAFFDVFKQLEVQK
jgi:ubiquinone/menaquinone biosynthesis C-methylase UbiE